MPNKNKSAVDSQKADSSKLSINPEMDASGGAKIDTVSDSEDKSKEITEVDSPTPTNRKRVQIAEVAEEHQSKEETDKRDKESDEDNQLKNVDSEKTIKQQSDAISESKCFPSPPKSAMDKENENEANENETDEPKKTVTIMENTDEESAKNQGELRQDDSPDINQKVNEEDQEG